jgi:thiamine-phosphate pyrophosphorylase
MASRNQPAEPRRPAPRLYLAIPAAADPARFANEIAIVLEAADVAAVLLSLADADDRSLINGIKAMVPVVQAKGAALVLDGRADLVARAGADGAHFTGIDAFTRALPTLKPERIAGCGGLTSRHDAMLAAEAGADYVMFGEPDVSGQRPAFDAILERLEWWAEVFEIPCVGYADSLDEIAPLAKAGADFVAVGPFIFSDPRGPAAALAAAAARLSLAETAA